MIDLAPIKARLAAATPGPWREGLNGGSSGITTEDEWRGMESMVHAGRALIAHAPTDMAGLVAEVERLRAALVLAAGALGDAPHLVVFTSGGVITLLDRELDDLTVAFPDDPIHYLFDRREAGL
jgi:hypothetical protein